ncbi:L,D-transpeptidase family protein [Marinobacteraceae bacterium S3BR75-40.1]
MSKTHHSKRIRRSRRSSRYRIVVVLLLLGVTATTLADELQESLRQRIEAIEAGFAPEVQDQQLWASPALVRFYTQRGFRSAWLDAGHLGNQVNALLQALRDARRHGLQPRDYHERSIVQLMSTPNNELSLQARIDLDLLLSDAFLTLGTHLSEGKLIGKDHFQQTTGELLPLLEQGLSSQSVGPILSTLGPQQPGYQALLQERRRIQALLQEPWQVIETGPVIRPNSRSDRMPQITQRLQQLGDLRQNVPATDRYNALRVEAVKHLQRRHSLKDDGLIGPKTLTILNMHPMTRLETIDANLERWRWLPEQLGERYVLVNLALLELEAVADDQVIQNQDIGVGAACLTPSTHSYTMHYLVLNPSWVVPPDVAVKHLWNEVQGHPDRLERAGFALYAGWGEQERQLDLETTDWTLLDDDPVPYRLIQAPGPKNALGNLAFRFDDGRHMLHGTPQVEPFGGHATPFSVGCIRLQDARQLAIWLLGAQEGFSQPVFEQQLASGETRTVPLEASVPVHIEYRTAWVDGALGLHLVPDWRERDEGIARDLAKPLQELL